MNLLRVCVLLLAVSAFAADTNLSALLKSVESRYNRSETLQVQFTEAYTVPGRPRRVESGVLMLRKPGRMRWDYTSPKGKLFVSDGKDLWLYVPSTKRVEKTRMKQSEDMRAPLAFLLGKLHFDKEFKSLQGRPEGADTLITAEPKTENLPYSRVEFVVTPEAQIRRVQVTGYDQSILEFTFSDEKLNPRLSAELFRFQMPPGAVLDEGGR